MLQIIHRMDVMLDSLPVQKSRQLLKRALQVMPHGVSSNYRYIDDQSTPVFSHGKGAYLFDPDGNRYLDYRLGWGPIILGHADDLVNDRVKKAIDTGQVFAGTHELEVKVAERIVDLCPGVDMVRLTNTGSEATLHSLRLARGYTGRDLILKFEGSYHGAHDYVLWSTANAPIDKVGSYQQPNACRASIGIPQQMQDLILTCPWNNKEILGEMLREKGEQVAAIIMEPMLGNGNALMPDEGYLQFVREQCDEYGIVLIYDEVKVGFRIAAGGAREYFNVIPDLSTYAKALANGYPIAAIAGKRELMMHFGPGKVFQSGTYSGNVVSTAAADATLERIQTGDVHRQINSIGNALMRGLKEILTRHGLPHQIHGAPALFGISFSEKMPRDWRELMQIVSFKTYESVISYMIENGVLREPFALEPFYLCEAHTTEHVDLTLQLFDEGLKKVLEGSYTTKGLLPFDAEF